MRKAVIKVVGVIGILNLAAFGANSVVRPVSITLTGGADAFFPVNNLINGSGLSSPLNGGDVLTNVTHDWNVNAGGDSWVSGAPGGYPSDWFAATGTLPTFLIDLGADIFVSDIHLWAYSAGSAGGYQGNSAKSLEFRFNSTAQGSSLFLGPVTNAQMDHAFDSATPPGSSLPRQDTTLSNSVTARYVQMIITDNWFVAPGDASGVDVHGHPMNGGDRVGLGEVRFSAVPEPGTALALAGGALALAMRRSRRASRE